MKYKRLQRNHRAGKHRHFKNACVRKIKESGPQNSADLMKVKTADGNSLKQNLPKNTTAASLILKNDKRFVLLNDPRKERVSIYGLAEKEETK